MNDAPEEIALLQALGARIRTIRARRGMTQRALSERSGVSERYIAQFEAGSGNVSLLVLHRVGTALGVPVAELVADKADHPAELAALHAMLARLDGTKLSGARRILAEWLGPTKRPGAAWPHRPDRATWSWQILPGQSPGRPARREVHRTGPRGRAAERGWTSATSLNCMVRTGFAGGSGRRWKQPWAGNGPMVLAAGGGIVAEEATLELLLSRCFTVWIRTSPEEHMQRVVTQGDHRPMRDNADAMSDLRAILASREALYARSDRVFGQ